MTKIRAGLYEIEGWRVEDVKSTTGWRISLLNCARPHRWFGTLGEARAWIAANGQPQP